MGILLLAIWPVLEVSGVLPAAITAGVAWIGVGVLLAGSLATATRPDSVRVEVAGDV
jgi:hypothetical protein